MVKLKAIIGIIKAKVPLLRLGSSLTKTLYLSTFFLITPVTILVSVFAIDLLAKSKSHPQAENQLSAIQAPNFGTKIYASLPDSSGQVLGEATSADARVEILRQYLESYKSPLEPHVKILVDASEKYELDFRLLVAIAQQESNVCKKIPPGSHNCWGWGIHSRGTLMFESFPEAIETVSRGLKEEYIDRGYKTPEEIMSKYAPSSPGTWALGVNQFLLEME